MRPRDAKDLLHQFTILQGGGTQVSPILSLSSFDHVIESGKGITFVIQMPMQHSLPHCEARSVHNNSRGIPDTDSVGQASSIIIRPIQWTVVPRQVSGAKARGSYRQIAYGLKPAPSQNNPPANLRSARAAHHDLRSQGDHRTRRRRLLARGAAAGQSDLKARGGRGLDDFALR